MKNNNLTIRILCFLCCLAVVFTISPFSSTVDAKEKSQDIIILYTNDIHTYIDGDLSYDLISGIKDYLKTQYENVLLVDAGDHAQGTAYGSMDKGKTVITLMNQAGYDLSTLGNHEFDYGMEGCKNIIEWAEYPYVSCNFYELNNGVRGENILESYKIFDLGTEKIAFIGITTPETLTKTTPAYFQDGNGNYIYGISGGNDGKELYDQVQNSIDNAKSQGTTKIIALGHLGVDPSSIPFTSENTIENTIGLNAFIDGHSHTVIESRPIKDKGGNSVILTQTGQYLNSLGIMVIDADSGEIKSDLIEYNPETQTIYCDFFQETKVLPNQSVKEIKDNWMAEIDNKLGDKIGNSLVVFDNYDTDGNRLVRSQETNSGDFSADSLYYLFDNMGLDVDIAIMNGGGTRNSALTGDLTYKNCKDIHPFGNVACLMTVSGQQILDMLEWGARQVGVAEDGSFLQVSGITYEINTSIEFTAKADENDVWVKGPENYRVTNIKIYNKEKQIYEDIDLNAFYNLAGYNYTLRDLGGGFAMLNGADLVQDYVMEDYLVLANYIKGFEAQTIHGKNSPLLTKYPNMKIDYSQVTGSGRIVIANQPQIPEELPPTSDFNDLSVYLLFVIVGLAVAVKKVHNFRLKY